MGEIDPAFIQATEQRPKLTVVKAGGIPLIDLSILNSHPPEGSTDDLVAISSLVEEIGGACKDGGFFLVINHGVPLDVHQRVETPAKEFFDLHQLYLIWEEGTTKMTDLKGSTSSDTGIRALHKEWDEASCPICMDHPHNAVLLICSSHDKGCRSYVCDTSYRHSNCLDRFKKLRVEPRNNSSWSRSSFAENSDSLRLGLRPHHGHNSEPNFEGSRMRNGLADEVHEHYISDETNEGTSNGSQEAQVNSIEEPDRNLETQGDDIVEMNSSETLRQRSGCEEGNLLGTGWNLKCPLCRGTVRGWKIVKEARHYLDLKCRGCSRESCSFFGNYRELRRHARTVHPTTRPADVDPSRQHAWRHLEHQREYGDIVSAIRSAMPGAVVLGDYVIESGEGLPVDRESNSSEGSGPPPWWTTFFLFQMIAPVAEPRGLSRAWTRHRRSSGSLSSRRNLWGENLLGLQDDEDDWNVASDIGEGVPPAPRRRSDIGEDVPPVPRRRRRLTRSRPNEDQL